MKFLMILTLTLTSLSAFARVDSCDFADTTFHSTSRVHSDEYETFGIEIRGCPDKIFVKSTYQDHGREKVSNTAGVVYTLAEVIYADHRDDNACRYTSAFKENVVCHIVK